MIGEKVMLVQHEKKRERLQGPSDDFKIQIIPKSVQYNVKKHWRSLIFKRVSNT